VPYLSGSAVVIHYEAALYQVYAPLPYLLPLTTSLTSCCFMTGHSHWVLFVAWSPDGKKLASGCKNGDVSIHIFL